MNFGVCIVHISGQKLNQWRATNLIQSYFNVLGHAGEVSKGTTSKSSLPILHTTSEDWKSSETCLWLFRITKDHLSSETERERGARVELVEPHHEASSQAVGQVWLGRSWWFDPEGYPSPSDIETLSHDGRRYSQGRLPHTHKRSRTLTYIGAWTPTTL